MSSEEPSNPLFPPLTRDNVLAFQFSSWYPKFRQISIKSTVIRPLSKEFREYLDADGVFLPEGSEDQYVLTTALYSVIDGDSDDSHPGTKYAFPELDAQIRQAIAEYDGVFPKLNFSSPRDASWILPAGSPMKCTSPADVYMLLKSSDFISHDLDEENVFDGCEPPSGSQPEPYALELVLRKWYSVDPSRELRCFVRQGRLIGISQRDMNYYEYLNEPDTSRRVLGSVREFWEQNIKGKWDKCPTYVFDILLTRDLSRAHIVDFNPYAPRTDSLLFTYEDLRQLATSSHAPELRVVDSRSHPAVTRNAPANQHNMLPLEALQMSNGLDIDTFAGKWEEEIKKTLED
ncbi:cytoplasmic protein [Heliocybe sulcata]|uniref:Cytoplasmic protein n=1 Tax=Heliocybe sulcata TaxID=5364 RepID=A0A5C3N514_9AGAM|nr:cytoplasmic protein [Heliocybe sulcata]